MRSATKMLAVREQAGPDFVYWLGSAKFSNKGAYLFRNAYVIAEGRVFTEAPPAVLAAMPEIRRAYLGL